MKSVMHTVSMRPLQRTRKGAPQAWHQPRAGRRASACASAHRRGPSGVGSSQHEQYPQQQRQQQDLAPAGAETPLPPPAASTSTPLPPPTPALPPPAPPLTLTEPAERFREWLRQRRELLRLAAEWLLYHYYNTRSPATDLQLLAFAYVSTMLLLAAAQHYTLDAPGVAFWADLYRISQWNFGEGFPDSSAAGGQQMIALLTAAAGLLGFALILALVEQVVLEGLDANVKRGRCVFEEGHIVLLSWCTSQRDLEVVRKIVAQTCLAYKPEGGTTVVVMSARSKLEMEAIIARDLPPERRHGTKIVCRQGSPLIPNDLALVSAHTARAALIISDQSRSAAEADAQSLRAAILLDELDASTPMSRDGAAGLTLDQRRAVTRAAYLAASSTGGPPTPAGSLTGGGGASGRGSGGGSQGDSPGGSRAGGHGGIYISSQLSSISSVVASQAFASPAASGASSLEDGGGPSGTPFVVAAAAFTRDAGGVPGAPGPCPAGAPPGAGGAGQRSAQGARQACDQGLGQLQRRAQQGQQGQHDQRQQDDAVDLHRHVVVEIKTANALPLVKYACTGRVIALPTGPINAARLAQLVKRPFASVVSQQLMNFESDMNAYTQIFPELERRRFADVAYLFPDAVVLGVITQFGTMLAPPTEYIIQPKDILVFVRPSQISAAQCRPLERMAPAAQLFGPDTGAAARHLPFGGWGVGAAACVRPSGACDGTGCHGQAAACAQCIDARSRRAQAAGKGPDPGPCGADCPNLSKRMRRLREQWSAPGPRPQQRAPHGAGGGGGGTSVAATSETDAALLLSTEYLTVDDEPEHVLVAGWGTESLMENLLQHLDGGHSGLPPGSAVTFVNAFTEAETLGHVLRRGATECIRVNHVQADPLQRSQLASKLDIAKYKCALVVCDYSWLDPDRDDSNGLASVDEPSVLRIDSLIMTVQLNIRKMISDAHLPPINIICQKVGTEGITRFEDRQRLPLGIAVNFNSYAAKLLTQMAFNPGMLPPIMTLGAEAQLQIVDASCLAGVGEAVTWWTLVARCQARRDVLLGLYEIPVKLEHHLTMVLNPWGQDLRSTPRVWATGDGRLKFIVVRDASHRRLGGPKAPEHGRGAGGGGGGAGGAGAGGQGGAGRAQDPEEELAQTRQAGWVAGGGGGSPVGSSPGSAGASGRGSAGASGRGSAAGTGSFSGERSGATVVDSTLE